MEINYIAVAVCAVLSMVVGFVWYGPLFGKKWMEIAGMDKETEERRKEMMKDTPKLYVAQFLISLGQVYILAHFIKGWSDVSGVESALWIWAGFVLPTVAAASMWTADRKEVKWARFLIQGGYYLVLFVMFGYILGTWT